MTLDWKKLPREATWLAVILAVALALRLWNVCAQPYWGDEVLSLDIARHVSDDGEMVRYLSQVEFHPPLYYIILHPWIRLFGESTGATRALSVAFSLANVALVYVFGKRLFSSYKAGLYAAAVMA